MVTVGRRRHSTPIWVLPWFNTDSPNFFLRVWIFLMPYYSLHFCMYCMIFSHVSIFSWLTLFSSLSNQYIHRIYLLIGEFLQPQPSTRWVFSILRWTCLHFCGKPLLNIINSITYKIKYFKYSDILTRIYRKKKIFLQIYGLFVNSNTRGNPAVRELALKS